MIKLTNIDVIFLTVLIAILILILINSNISLLSLNKNLRNISSKIYSSSLHIYDVLTNNYVANRIRLMFNNRHHFMIKDRELIQKLEDTNLGTMNYDKSRCYEKARYKIAERIVYDLTLNMFGSNEMAARDLQILHSIGYTIGKMNYSNIKPRCTDYDYITKYNNGLRILNLYDDAIGIQMNKRVLSMINQNKIDTVRRELYDLYSRSRKLMSLSNNINGDDMSSYNLNSYSSLSRFMTLTSDSTNTKHAMLILAIEMRLVKKHLNSSGNILSAKTISSIIDYSSKFGLLFNLAEDFTRYYEDIYYSRPNIVADTNIETAYKTASSLFVDIISDGMYRKLRIDKQLKMLMGTIDVCYSKIL